MQCYVTHYFLEKHHYFLDYPRLQKVTAPGQEIVWHITLVNNRH